MRFVRARFAFPPGKVSGGRFALRISLYDVLWWIIAALIAGLGAAVVWALVTPLSPLGEWRPASVKVLSPASRAAVFASVDPFNRAATPAGAAPASGTEIVTGLSLTLFGTRAMPGGQGTAIIAGADGVQAVYRVGSEVAPGATLAEVAFDHVVLSRNGARELLYLDQSDAAPSAQAIVAGNPVAAPAGAGGALTADAARKGISFAPRAEGGRMVGLEVQPGGDGSAFRAAGFQPGDVVTMVDGKAISGPADGAALAGALKPGASVSVTVRRGGQNLPLAITLAP